MSDIIRKLREVREVAWAGLVPAIDHAIMRAEECEFIASEASNLAQCSADPAYPPLVLKLATALDGGNHDDRLAPVPPKGQNDV